MSLSVAGSPYSKRYNNLRSSMGGGRFLSYLDPIVDVSKQRNGSLTYCMQMYLQEQSVGDMDQDVSISPISLLFLGIDPANLRLSQATEEAPVRTHSLLSRIADTLICLKQ